jgi:hypothetical protein
VELYYSYLPFPGKGSLSAVGMNLLTVTTEFYSSDHQIDCLNASKLARISFLKSSPSCISGEVCLFLNKYLETFHEGWVFLHFSQTRLTFVCCLSNNVILHQYQRLWFSYLEFPWRQINLRKENYWIFSFFYHSYCIY